MERQLTLLILSSSTFLWESGLQFHVKLQTLPPTSAAAKYHSLCVYLQIQQWKGSSDVQQTAWGWRECDKGFLPLQTSLAPAHGHLLRVIRCNCKADCSTMKCTCKKHNIDCKPACGNCRGSGCLNTQHDSYEEEEDCDSWIFIQTAVI